jgi:hypothetical protein
MDKLVRQIFWPTKFNIWVEYSLSIDFLIPVIHQPKTPYPWMVHPIHKDSSNQTHPATGLLGYWA